MKISPRYKDLNWQSLAFKEEKDWQKAIDIFRDRIDGRFLEPIRKIEEDEFSGFAVMALDCLLIETFQQFRKGVDRTPYKKEEEYFKEFLTTTSFKDYFDKKSAKMFYDHVRCGILHQAETKKSTTLRITKGFSLVKYADDGDGLIINRKKFHQQLEVEFNRYLEELSDSSNVVLRESFKKKMNFICRK